MHSQRKKICFIVSSSLTVRAFLLSHIKSLSVEYDIHIAGNFSPLEMEELVSLTNIRCYSVLIERKINIHHDIQAIWHLQKFFRNEKFDVIHSVTPKAGLLSMIAGKIAGIPRRIHIFTGQVWHTKKGLFKTTLKFLDKLIVAFSTDILVDGRGQMEFLINNGVIDRSKITLLANGSISGVETNRFSPDPLKKKTFREELGLKHTDIILLYLGRLNKDKGVLDLVMAYRLVSEKFHNIKLLLVGYDEENIIPKVENILNINEYEYWGHTNDPVAFYQASDIYCLPSYREGFGSSVLEASSTGLAIICSDTYGLRDTIINGKTGLKHKVGNIEDLIDKLTILISDQQSCKQLGQNGRDYVLNNFSSGIVTGAWLEYYRKILN